MRTNRLDRIAAGVVWSALAVAGYVSVGYPLSCALLARLRPRPVRRDADATPSISLVVAAHNEGDVLADKLASVERVDYPSDRLEILIVDDGSTDDTVAIASRPRSQPVRVIRQSRQRGKATAVNLGVAEARGDVIVLSDASAELEPGALRAIVAPLADPSVGAVSGTLRYREPDGSTATPANLYWRYEDALRRWESMSGSTVGVNGNLFAFRRVEFEVLPAETVNDEFTIAVRIAAGNQRVIYEPTAVTVDLAATSRAEADRRTRITAARVQSLLGPARRVWRRPGLAFRVTSHKALRGALPAAAMGLLVGSVVLSVRHRRGVAGPVIARLVRLDSPFAESLLAAQLTVLGAAGAAVALERSGRRPPRALDLARYLVAVNAGGLRGLARAATGRHSAVWRTGRESRT